MRYRILYENYTKDGQKTGYHSLGEVNGMDAVFNIVEELIDELIRDNMIISRDLDNLNTWEYKWNFDNMKSIWVDKTKNKYRIYAKNRISHKVWWNEYYDEILMKILYVPIKSQLKPDTDAIEFWNLLYQDRINNRVVSPLKSIDTKRIINSCENFTEEENLTKNNKLFFKNKQ